MTVNLEPVQIERVKKPLSEAFSVTDAKGRILGYVAAKKGKWGYALILRQFERGVVFKCTSRMDAVEKLTILRGRS